MKPMSVMLFTVMVSSLVMAQTGRSPASFDQLDVDRNGLLSVSEAEANVQLLEMFNQLDANGDGNLNREEFALFNKHE